MNWNSGQTGEPPALNRRRALVVLAKIDEILAWEKTVDSQRDTRFVELGRYLCEVRSGQYWRLDNLSCFEEFLEKKFPESRRKAYYLMAIHEHLPPEVRKHLKKVGWTKAAELVKVARSKPRDFDCATWLHKAEQLPKEEFQREVERHLTGKDTEPWEIIYFKLYKSQLPVIEQALEIAALMLGSDKSRGYCLEMICADFLSGANLQNENGSANSQIDSLQHIFQLLSPERKTGVSGTHRDGTMRQFLPKRPRKRLDPEAYRALCNQVLARDKWRCQGCGRSTDLQVHHIRPRARQGDDLEQNLITLCAVCHKKIHRGGRFFN